MNKIENLTPKRLSDVYGATERWWQRKLPELCKQGIVSKRGRLFFGRLDDIAAWLHPGSSRTHLDSGVMR